jgi:hypothetical protein
MWVVVFFLVGFWGLGLLSGYFFAGFIHILLIYAAVMVPAIVGLLNALPETRLYRPLLKEERLESDSSGTYAEAWLHFRANLNREFLVSGYRDSMRRLYELGHYYLRLRTFLERQNPCGPRLVLSWPHFRPFSRLWLRSQATQGAPAL